MREQDPGIKYHRSICAFAAARELAPYTHPKLSSIEARTGCKTDEENSDGEGRKAGGRRKGTLNKVTAARRAALATLNGSHTDPISFFCNVLRDENAPRAERRDAAKMLLPYYHPKLAGLGPLLLEFLKGGYHETTAEAGVERGPLCTITPPPLFFQPL